MSVSMSSGLATVHAMDLIEARVTALEEGLRVVREEELPALRAETRGWATVALRVEAKVDTASEFMKLIYKDLRGVKDDVTEVKEDMKEVKQDIVGLKVDMAEVKEDMKE